MKLQFTNEPLGQYFRTLLHDAIYNESGVLPSETTEAYLADLLVRFAHFERMHGIRDAFGHRIPTVTGMLPEADIRLHANSFLREREVHKHIGDYLLFWAGMYPEYFEHLRKAGHVDGLIDAPAQGKASYYIASSYRESPYEEEAEVLYRLSDEFDGYMHAVKSVRKRMN